MGRRAYSSHILEKKSPKRKRRMARPVEVEGPGQGARQRAARDAQGELMSPLHQCRRAPPPPQEGPQAGQGLLRPQALELPLREGAGPALGQLRLPRPAPAQARLPPPVDRPDQRRRARRGHELLGVHARPQAGRASRSTARCSPTSRCATATRSADLPSSPGRLPLPERVASDDSPGRHMRRPFFAMSAVTELTGIPS